jgi:patatin-like phospholipase/acyl hydrolase
MPKHVKVLSIDGGGVYGIVSAMVLAEIERRIGKRCAAIFDFIAGTSTGGIIALGLTKPDKTGRHPEYTALDLAELYQTQSKHIFSRTLVHQILALDHLIDEKYQSRGVDEVLHSFFGQSLLSDSLTEVLITSYDIERRSPFFFKRHKAKKSDGRDYLIREIARATSAAPSYFEPAKCTNIDKSQTFFLIDGGVYANHPAMCAYAEVKALYPDVNQITLVSLGTGGVQRPYRYEDAKGWGTAQWMVPLLDVIFDGVAETVDYQLQHIFMLNQSEKNNYNRITVPVPPGYIEFDDTSEASLRILKEYAEKFIASNDVLFETLAEKLTT